MSNPNAKLSRMHPTLYQRFGKRAFDLLASAAGLLLLSPLLAVVAIAVKLSSPGPAIFRQLRMGRYQIPFFILKFRSMRTAAPQEKGSLLTAAGDPRVTPLGHFIRKTKLDELPQLWNVL